MKITFKQGGMREFEETGVYPEYLLFNLPGTRQNWRVRIKEKPQSGLIKSKGQPVYEYRFKGESCCFRSLCKTGSHSDWRKPEFIKFEMID